MEIVGCGDEQKTMDNEDCTNTQRSNMWLITRSKRTKMARRLIGRQLENIILQLRIRNNQVQCMLCGQKEISEYLYGVLYQLGDVAVHYFCILLSRAAQNGESHDGICGFLLPDIQDEILRGSTVTCVYCKQKGATISCSGADFEIMLCDNVFHLPCGLRNGSMHQYFESFHSFCHQHSIKQSVDEVRALGSQDPGAIKCAICLDDGLQPPSVYAPCCKCNVWFHRRCIQRLALNAANAFKCPYCNNDGIFKRSMQEIGIYVPVRAPSWETTAYLIENNIQCNAEICQCPFEEGRKFNLDLGAWEIVNCYLCGSDGIHLLCGGLKKFSERYCTSCRPVE